MVVPDFIVERTRFHCRDLHVRNLRKAARPGVIPGSASKSGLDGLQTAEEPPRQPGVIGQHDAMRG
jgi:hypothetical protein